MRGRGLVFQIEKFAFTGLPNSPNWWDLSQDLILYARRGIKYLAFKFTHDTFLQDFLYKDKLQGHPK